MTKDEYCVVVLESIGTKTYIPLTTNDIDIVHRGSTAKKYQTNLIVKFETSARKLDINKKTQWA